MEKINIEGKVELKAELWPDLSTLESCYAYYRVQRENFKLGAKLGSTSSNFILNSFFSLIKIKKEKKSFKYYFYLRNAIELGLEISPASERPGLLYIEQILEKFDKKFENIENKKKFELQIENLTKEQKNVFQYLEENIPQKIGANPNSIIITKIRNPLYLVPNSEGRNKLVLKLAENLLTNFSNSELALIFINLLKFYSLETESYFCEPIFEKYAKSVLNQLKTKLPKKSIFFICKILSKDEPFITTFIENYLFCSFNNLIFTQLIFLFTNNYNHPKTIRKIYTEAIDSFPETFINAELPLGVAEDYILRPEIQAQEDLLIMRRLATLSTPTSKPNSTSNVLKQSWARANALAQNSGSAGSKK